MDYWLFYLLLGSEAFDESAGMPPVTAWEIVVDLQAEHLNRLDARYFTKFRNKR